MSFASWRENYLILGNFFLLSCYQDLWPSAWVLLALPRSDASDCIFSSQFEHYRNLHDWWLCPSSFLHLGRKRRGQRLYRYTPSPMLKNEKEWEVLFSCLGLIILLLDIEPIWLELIASHWFEQVYSKPLVLSMRMHGFGSMFIYWTWFKTMSFRDFQTLFALT